MSEGGKRNKLGGIIASTGLAVVGVGAYGRWTSGPAVKHSDWSDYLSNQGRFANKPGPIFDKKPDDDDGAGGTGDGAPGTGSASETGSMSMEIAPQWIALGLVVIGAILLASRVKFSSPQGVAA